VERLQEINQPGSAVTPSIDAQSRAQRSLSRDIRPRSIWMSRSTGSNRAGICIQEHNTEGAFPISHAQTSLVTFEARQNLTGASITQIKRSLARAWRLVLASRIDEALGATERIELQLDDVPSSVAQPFRAATQLLRATSLAFQDDSLAALAIALPHLKENGRNQDYHAASTLCRLGYWHLRNFDRFHSLPRPQPRSRWSKSGAVSAMLDLSIEAAVALEHLQLGCAKRLASDAFSIAEVAITNADGLSALPACLIAEVLYEEGCLDQAEVILRERLAVINAEGPIECALRAYRVLSRIARHTMQYDYAAFLLREAEVLGERRGWPRLVAACMAERVSLLLQGGRMTDARICSESLDRFVETLRPGSGYSGLEILQYRSLARWRVSWAETQSSEAAAGLRRLYYNALEKGNVYAGCGLAVELAEALAAAGHCDEADALFFHTVRVGATAGLYQTFLDAGAGVGMLLRRAYERAEVPESPDREVLPYLGSLLSRWDQRLAGGRPAQSDSRVSDTITARERDILVMISQGSSNKRIARDLKISPETVKSHNKRIFMKLGASTRTEAVCRAGSMGLL
jgi:ATP/maltotriose-dependent transcriptional regulator MalT